MKTVYFDNAASTRTDPRVLEAMLPYFCECYANPSALHSPAQRARAEIEKSREKIAEYLGAQDASEIIFTSGATEANNTVINAFSGQMLVSAIEHPSVLNTATATQRAHLIPVDESGLVRMDIYAQMLEEVRPQLVSVMLVNNEIGTVQDIDTIGKMAHDAGARFHTDLTQGVGKCKMDLAMRPVDYATMSGHKFYAPKGVGALWVRDGAPFHKFQHGGTHENFRRAGTLNAPGIIGLGKAIEILESDAEEDNARAKAIRERLLDRLFQLPDVRLNGHPSGVPHILSVSFHRTEGESVIINLDSKGICCTAGSACSSGMHLKSQVLTAIGLPDDWLRGTVRLSIGRFNTLEEADLAAEALVQAVSEVRNLAGFAAG